MRQTTVNTVIVSYPEQTVFTADNIFISLSDSNYTVGAEISITNMSTLQTKTLTYISELKDLTFDIGDVIRMLHREGGSSINVKVKVYTDMFYVGTFSFNLQTLDGRSLPQRSHGSARTFYVYDPSELYKFHLFLVGTGALTVDGGSNIPVTQIGRNSFNLQNTITTYGEHQWCYAMGVKGGDIEEKSYESVEITNVEPSVFSGVVSLYYHTPQPVPTDPIKGGGVWNDERMNLAEFCGRIIFDEACDDFDFFELMYYDTDGCVRYLGGKIQSETTQSKGKNFVGVRDSVFRDISHRHIEEASGTVKVAFNDLRRDSYYSDILLSPHVYFKNYAGDWMPCSIADSKITVKSEDYADLELNIELYKM